MLYYDVGILVDFIRKGASMKFLENMRRSIAIHRNQNYISWANTFRQTCVKEDDRKLFDDEYKNLLDGYEPSNIWKEKK